MTLVETKLTDLEEIKTRLGRNQKKVAERLGISPAHVCRVLNGDKRVDISTKRNVIDTCLSVINETSGTTEIDETGDSSENKLLEEKIIAIIEATSQRTAKYYRELDTPTMITRRQAIAKYFDNKSSRYETYMDRYGKDIAITKGDGRNCTIYVNRKDLEDSFRKNNISF